MIKELNVLHYETYNCHHRGKSSGLPCRWHSPSTDYGWYHHCALLVPRRGLRSVKWHHIFKIMVTLYRLTQVDRTAISLRSPIKSNACSLWFPPKYLPSPGIFAM